MTGLTRMGGGLGAGMTPVVGVTGGAGGGGDGPPAGAIVTDDGLSYVVTDDETDYVIEDT